MRKVKQNSYRVTFEFAPNDIVNDIALSADTIVDALEYAMLRAEDMYDKLPYVVVDRISRQTAEDIVKSGGIDWLN